jgi:hypothetical protein
MTSPRKEEEVFNRSSISSRTVTSPYQHACEQERSLGAVVLQTAISTHSGPLDIRGSSSALTTLFFDECVCNHEEDLPESREDCEDATGGGCGKGDILKIVRRLQRSLYILRGDDCNDNTAGMLEDIDSNQDSTTIDSQAGLLFLLPSETESLSRFLEKAKQQREQCNSGVTEDDECSFQSFDSLKYYRRERSSTLNDTSIGSSLQTQKDPSSSR